MGAEPDEHGRDSLCRHRLGQLHAELRRIETYVSGLTPLQGRDPEVILATLATEITRLRQIAGCYLSSNDRDA